MKTLLHIIASPRQEQSRTLKVSAAFLAAFKEKYPKAQVKELNLFQEKLPALTLKLIDGKYALLSGKELNPEMQEAWKGAIKLIEQFLGADAYLLSTPMWNFGIPHVLKHYLDVIVQPKYLFQYTPTGPEGLVKNKKMVVITSRGGDYTQEPAKKFDLQEPYLRTVFGFVGLAEVIFVNAQPMDALGPQVQAEKIEVAKQAAVAVAKKF